MRKTAALLVKPATRTLVPTAIFAAQRSRPSMNAVAARKMDRIKARHITHPRTCDHARRTAPEIENGNRDLNPDK